MVGGNELIVILGSAENWKRFRGIVKDYTLRKEHKAIIDALEVYYRNNPTCAVVEWPSFETWFMTTRGMALSPAEAKAYQMMFDRINKDATSGTVSLDDVLDHYIKLDYTARVQNEVGKILRDPSHDLGEVGVLVESYNREVSRVLSKSDVFVEPDLGKVFAEVSAPGFEWGLPFLNRAIGPIRKGDFIIVAARPETGKTTFIASQVTHMAQQAIESHRPIIWVNNEERSEKVYFRCVQSAFRATRHEIELDLATFATNFKTLVPTDRLLITVKDGHKTDVASLDRMFEEHNPCLIIFDQLDKVDGFGSEPREDMRLGKLYGWGRDLAAKYGPTIAVSQLSEGADGMMYPGYNWLRGSKTDKSGEADVIITIGSDPGKGPNARGIYLPKNKQFGSAGTDESLRHGKCELEIVPDRCYYKEP